MTRMTDTEWRELCEAMADLDTAGRALAAAQQLQSRVVQDDQGRLMRLLEHELFTVREAAAWCLSDLGAAHSIPGLLAALKRGAAEGLDNDGLVAAILDLAEVHPVEVRREAERILQNGPDGLREQAQWLVEFMAGL